MVYYLIYTSKQVTSSTFKRSSQDYVLVVVSHRPAQQRVGR